MTPQWGAQAPILTRPRLAVFLAGLAAAVFLAWPTFSIDRDSDWRKVLAGFQLQRETGVFIGASSSLIHLHGLAGRRGLVAFALAPRIQGDLVEVDIAGPEGVQHLVLGEKSLEVKVPFGASDDLELKIETTKPASPRPLLLSNLRMVRDLTAATVLSSLLPLLLGALVFPMIFRGEPALARTLLALFVIAASTFFMVIAADPARDLSFPMTLRAAMPLALALGFAPIGIRGATLRPVALALAGITLSLHLLTVRSGFVYDDRLWARSWTLPEIASTFWGSEDPRGISGEQYRPLPSLTHAVDHALWGPSPFAFHLTNMALHALSALLVFSLLSLLRVPRPAAFIGALTLAAHPLAASSVGWISERTDTLADIFMVATLIVFLGAKGTRPLSVLGVFLLALWSKETAVMLPVIALLFAGLFLDAEERKARFATLRALFGLAALFVVVWVSLFPEKTVGRLQATAASLESSQSGWTALFENFFSQLFHPIGFEAWRAVRDTQQVALWTGATVLLTAVALGLSSVDPARSRSWRLVAAGLAYAALIVLPFRGHDAVDVYRLGHSPTVGFAMALAGFAALLGQESRLRSLALGALLLLRFGAVASETSLAWGYPGFQFRMALRFNRENPTFLAGLTPEMREDLEREIRFEGHRDDPLRVPFGP